MSIVKEKPIQGANSTGGTFRRYADLALTPGALKLWNRLPIFRKLAKFRSNYVSRRDKPHGKRYICSAPSTRIKLVSTMRILDEFDLTQERREELLSQRNTMLHMLKTGIYW